MPEYHRFAKGALLFVKVTLASHCMGNSISHDLMISLISRPPPTELGMLGQRLVGLNVEPKAVTPSAKLNKAWPNMPGGLGCWEVLSPIHPIIQGAIKGSLV